MNEKFDGKLTEEIRELENRYRELIYKLDRTMQIGDRDEIQAVNQEIEDLLLSQPDDVRETILEATESDFQRTTPLKNRPTNLN